MTQTNLFDKQSSVAVKGLAVLMMVVLHMFAFPGRNGNLIECDFLGNRYTLAFGVCVSIYVFVAGYANGLMYKKLRESLWRKNLISIKKLYLKFLSIAIPILAIVYIINLTTVPNYGSTCQIASDLENLMWGGVKG